jgi:hypothetical protein
LPSGRQFEESAQPAEPSLLQPAMVADRRDLLEQQLEEAVNSVLKTVNGSNSSGRGG